MVKWYEWDSWESFNTWHNALCAKMGYPWDAYLQSTGQLDLEAQKVLRYTDGLEVQGKIIAIVEDKDSEGLIETQLRPSTPQPFPSWILNPETNEWEAPVPYPNDGKRYRWDEATLSWVEMPSQVTN